MTFRLSGLGATAGASLFSGDVGSVKRVPGSGFMPPGLPAQVQSATVKAGDIAVAANEVNRPKCIDYLTRNPAVVQAAVDAGVGPDDLMSHCMGAFDNFTKSMSDAGLETPWYKTKPVMIGGAVAVAAAIGLYLWKR